MTTLDIDLCQPIYCTYFKHIKLLFVVEWAAGDKVTLAMMNELNYQVLHVQTSSGQLVIYRGCTGYTWTCLSVSSVG